MYESWIWGKFFTYDWMFLWDHRKECLHWYPIRAATAHQNLYLVHENLTLGLFDILLQEWHMCLITYFKNIILRCVLITLRFLVAMDVVYVVYDIPAGAQYVLLLVLGGGLCCVVMHQPAIIRIRESIFNKGLYAKYWLCLLLLYWVAKKVTTSERSNYSPASSTGNI